MKRSIVLCAAALFGIGVTVVSSGCLGENATATVKTACVPFDAQDDEDAFIAVSEVLERRCGTLDCHGAIARPLRLYGNAGLRRPEPDLGSEGCTVNEECGPAGSGRICKQGLGCIDDRITNYAQYYPGGGIGTTPSERRDNWAAICGIEPELFTVVYCCAAGENVCGGFDYAANCADPEAVDPERLTLVRKARLREKHKGGLVWNEGDDGDTCLVSWITGAYSDPNVNPQACIQELQKL
ncbi:MAG: hypothetical protein IPK82_37295 [Polyangiaceae bacterium]|nr:hypothetical protein [Polyangiaceae bacterium]